MTKEDLQPFKPGYDNRRNYKGRPKGVTSLSTRVKNLLGDEKLLKAITDAMPDPPGWLKKLENKDIAEVIIMAMATKAMSGDVQAAAWIRKAGYGDKIEFGADDGKPIVPLVIYDFNAPITKPEKVKSESTASVDQPQARGAFRRRIQP